MVHDIQYVCVYVYIYIYTYICISIIIINSITISITISSLEYSFIQRSTHAVSGVGDASGTLIAVSLHLRRVLGLQPNIININNIPHINNIRLK